jgi:hypothetical protein
VACGEASSSVSTSGTQTSSSVSSTVSPSEANVTTITLTAATDVQKQVVSALKKVAVQATFNANANSNVAIEWFVEGTKSNQTGSIFEFTPNGAGEFKIQAKVGSVISNTLTINVDLPVFEISKLEFKANNKIEISAAGGATVTVTGNTVQPESYYDLENKMYVIFLKTALKQGDSATVTLERLDLGKVTKVALYDTRKVEVASVSGGTTQVKDNKDGSWDITRPHTLSAGALNTTIQTNVITFKSAEITGKSVAFKVERISAPANAEVFTTVEGLAEVAATNAGNRQLSLNLTKDTVPGAYKYKFTLDGIATDLTINVKVPEPTITLDTHTVTKPGVLPTLTAKYEVYFNQGDLQGTPAADTGISGNTGIVANADGVYEIVKDYVKDTLVYQTIYFRVDGANFLVPENQIASTSLTPNQVSVSVLGPNNTSIVRVQNGVTQAALPSAVSFRDTFSNFAVTQIVDAETPTGLYTFTVAVRQQGQIVKQQDVKILVKAPVAKLAVDSLYVTHLTTVAPAQTTASENTTYWFDTGSKELHTATDTVSWLNATRESIIVLAAEPTGDNADHPTLPTAIGTKVIWQTGDGTWDLKIKDHADNWNTAVIAEIPANYPNLSTANEVLYKIKETSSNVFEVQRPFVGSETQFISFPFLLSNYESPANPSGSLDNLFTGHSSVRKEFLEFKKSYTGPGTLNDNFTVDSKIAIEIGTDTVSQTGLEVVSNLATTNAKSYPRYRQEAAFDDNIISLGTQFVLPITSLTAAGDYVLTLKVGVVSTTITVKVLPATPEVDLSVLTRPEDAGTADVVELNTINVTEEYFFTLGADGKYYGNLGWDSPDTTGTNEGKITADLSLLIKNMELDDLPYKVVIDYPSRSETFSNILYEDAASNLGIYSANGRDGHLNAPYLLFLATGKAQSAANDGTFGTNTIYNKVNNTAVVNRQKTFAKSFSRLDIEEKGTYKITVEVNGVSKTIELVVSDYPTLTVNTVTNATLFDTVYLVKKGTADVKVTFNVKASNLPSSTFFKVVDSFVSGQTSGFYIYDTNTDVATDRTGIQSGNESSDIAATATQLTALSFNATTGLYGLEITVPAATANDARIRKTVAIYSRSLNYLGTTYTYSLIGHMDVLIWNNSKPID